jgi:hypothetical protein
MRPNAASDERSTAPINTMSGCPADVCACRRPGSAVITATLTTMTEQRQHTQESTGGASDAFSQFGEEVAASLRHEFEELREAAGERARAGARGAAFLTAAAVSGAVAAGAMLTLPVLALRRLLGPGPTALVMAAGAGGVTVYLAKRGLDELGVPTEAAAERVKNAARDAVATS